MRIRTRSKKISNKIELYSKELHLLLGNVNMMAALVAGDRLPLIVVGFRLHGRLHRLEVGPDLAPLLASTK